jgi:hypothetical protein
MLRTFIHENELAGDHLAVVPQTNSDIRGKGGAGGERPYTNSINGCEG